MCCTGFAQAGIGAICEDQWSEALLLLDVGRIHELHGEFGAVEGVDLDIKIAAHASAYIKDCGLRQGIVGADPASFEAEPHGYVQLP